MKKRSLNIISAHLTFLFCFVASYGFNQIPEARQKQLDSIVTNLDRNVLRNLDSVHHQLHHAGTNDEERVFLYYGLVAIHYKYDYNRKGDKNAKEYSAYYVAYKKKAVCRDFALIFAELCERSDIPCVIASGRVNVGLREGIVDMFKRRIKRVNHAWNVVKYNDDWHPVDPTWSKIDSVRKYYTYDEDGRRKYAGKVKISNRDYYKKDPREFYRKRTCVHPAFYCMDTVYTYKTSKRKYKNRKLYKTNYNYSAILDSISMNADYTLKREFQSALTAYANINYIYSTLSRDFKFAEIKYSKFDKLTPSDCDKHLSELDRKLKVVKSENDLNLGVHFALHKADVLKLKKRLVRREEALSRN